MHVQVVKVQPLVLRLAGEHSEAREFMVNFLKNCPLRTRAWFAIQSGVLATRKIPRISKAEFQMARKYVRSWTGSVGQSRALGPVEGQI